MPDSTASPSPGKRQRTILGHPAGLTVLFLTQMWERFSFFGMLALLILYLQRYFKLPEASATTVTKWYLSSIYFTPLIGGFLADRFLGTRRSVIIGTALMAVGHFLMTIPSLDVLYGALIVLVIGFGLLTPPLTAQVGRLYAPHDPRRDSAYTLFYMGINLGAFASPLACGWLQENTRGGFHSGFALAGIGMVIAFFTYMIGQSWIVEYDQVAPQPATNSSDSGQTSPGESTPLSEAAIAQKPSVVPGINRIAPAVLAGLGGLLALTGLGALLALAVPFLARLAVMTSDTAISLATAGVCLLVFGWVAQSVRNGLRDRVLVILMLGIFFAVFWSGSGHYPSAINIWADHHTNRYLTSPPQPPDPFPSVDQPVDSPGDDAGQPGLWDRWTNMFTLLPKKPAEKGAADDHWWTGLWNPVPTAWFQSLNPLFVFALAPLVAMLWPWLGKRGLNPSIPVKMALGLVLMALAFALMAAGGSSEAKTTRVAFPGDQLPPPLVVNEQRQICKSEPDKPLVPLDAGRLFFDRDARELRIVGVLPISTHDEIVGGTAPPDMNEKIGELAKRSAVAAAAAGPWQASVQLDRESPNLDLRYAGYEKPMGNKQVSYDPATRTLATTVILEEKEIKALQVAAGDTTLRAALDDLMAKSSVNRVSPWWLVGFFLLATLGELCCSPVGQSMVSQLAPARFSTLLMALWLMTFSFGYFVAGALGEHWGAWSPVKFFTVVLVMMAAAAVLLFALVRKLAALMHD